MANQKNHSYRIASQVLVAIEHNISFSASLDNDDLEFERSAESFKGEMDEIVIKETSIFFAGHVAEQKISEAVRDNSYTRGLVHAYTQFLEPHKRKKFHELIDSIYHSTVARISSPLNWKRIEKIAEGLETDKKMTLERAKEIYNSVVEE